jgi:choline-glycine betaine transporter
VVTEAVGGVFGSVAVLTAVFAAVARYAAVLLRREDRPTEYATAVGFFFGLLASLVLVIRDVVP